MFRNLKPLQFTKAISEIDRGHSQKTSPHVSAIFPCVVGGDLREKHPWIPISHGLFGTPTLRLWLRLGGDLMCVSRGRWVTRRRVKLLRKMCVSRGRWAIRPVSFHVCGTLPTMNHVNDNSAASVIQYNIMASWTNSTAFVNYTAILPRWITWMVWR